MSFYDRQLQGMISYRVGHLAEDAVARLYQGLGYRLEARCWRGVCGEIDLVFRHGGGWGFVEVKSSKTWARAAESLSRRQIGRVQNAALEFMAQAPKYRSTDMRFDVALVDGMGQIDVIENAFV